MKSFLVAVALLTPGVAAAQSAAGATNSAPTAGAQMRSTGDAALATDPGNPIGKMQPTPVGATKTAAKTDPTKILCRTRETLGSRLGGTRECHTRVEWEQINRQANDDINQRQRVPSTERPGG